MSTPLQASRMAALLFTDIVSSTELKALLGNAAYSSLLARHDALFRAALARFPSGEVINEMGDGYFLTFETASDAVRFALLFQRAIHDEPWSPQPLRVRVGVHVGEVAEMTDALGRRRVIGLAADLAGRICSLATAAQLLLTRTAFDEARQFVREYPTHDTIWIGSSPAGTQSTDLGPEPAGAAPPALHWIAHGKYLCKGAADPVEVFEAGAPGIAPLAPPPDSDKARRSVPADAEDTLGWRPAANLPVPQRPGWLLQRKLGEGTFGEVWLATHDRLHQHRVFKFCFDAERLRSFKRELTFFRLLRDALGDRPDIARLHDVRLDRPPFFLESDFVPAGNLIDWAHARQGLANVPLEDRLELLAKIADATAAAHSVGILHKDIKPSNILVHHLSDGSPQPQLADFGIGALADRSHLHAHHITAAGFTSLDDPRDSSRTGTRLYAPPESLANKPFTTAGDIYALGVLLYQLAVADLDRPLAPGWERDVPDELLRADISACVEGDPARRLPSATDLAKKLRALTLRRAKHAADAHQKHSALRRKRLLRLTATTAAVCFTLATAALLAFLRERDLRTTAEIHDAHATLEKGAALHFAGRPRQSRDALLHARAALAALGQSTRPADAALFRSFHEYEAPLLTLSGHTAHVMAAVFLPDGRHAVSAAEDGTVRLWDTLTGRQLRLLADTHHDILALALSRDGHLLLSGGADCSLRLWDLPAAKLLRAFPQPAPAPIRAVAFSPDASLAAFASAKPDLPNASGVVRVYDTSTGATLWSSPPGLNLGFLAIAFSPDSRRLLATTYQSSMLLWALPSRRAAGPLHPTTLPALLGHQLYIYDAVFTPDARHVLSAGADHTLKLWDLAAPRSAPPITLEGHAAAVRAVALVDTHAGLAALSASEDATLHLTSLNDRRVLHVFAGHTDAVTAVAVSSDGSLALSASYDNTLRLWNLRPDSDVPVIPRPAGVTALAPSPDGATLAVGDKLGGVLLYDSATAKPLRAYPGLHAPVACLAVLNDHRRLFAADCNGAALLWDLRTAAVLRSFPNRRPGQTESRIGAADWCHSAVDPNGRLAVSLLPDRHSLAVFPLDPTSPDAPPEFTLDSAGPAASRPNRSRDVAALALTPDASRLLTAHDDGSVSCWDLSSRSLLFSTPRSPRSGPVDSIAVSPDARRALFGGHDELLHLYDLDTRRQLRAFQGHTAWISGAAFAANDPALCFSSAPDQTLRLWDADTGEELDLGATFPFPAYAPLCPFPRSAAVACAVNKTVSLWDPARPARYLAFAPQVDAAQSTLAQNPTDPAALATLAQWYAFRNAPALAAQCWQDARANTPPSSPTLPCLPLARADWLLDHPTDAAREFTAALAQHEAPPDYLNLCLHAIADPPSTQPAATTSPLAHH